MSTHYLLVFRTYVLVAKITRQWSFADLLLALANPRCGGDSGC